MTDNANKKKIAMLAPVPAPYRAYEYDAVYQSLCEKYEFRCLFLESKFDMQWNDCVPKLMPYEVLPKSRLWNFYRKFHSTIRVNRSVLKILREYRPDFVITHGYDSPSMVIAVVWAKLHGKKVLFRSDANSIKLFSKPVPWYKKLFVRTYFKMVDAFLTIGSRNEEYYRFFGAKDEKFYRASYAVDSRFYQTRSEKARKDRQVVLNRYGISQKRLILFVGRLLELKGLDVLIQAFIRLKQTAGYDDLGLVLAGNGPEDERLKALAEPVRDSVYFPGFVQPEQVAELMGICDLFILPSRREQWGLVVNEAMESSLPIIISSRVGSAVDMVKHGVNGFVFEVDSVAELADNMAKIVSDVGLSESMRRESIALIKAWNEKYSVTDAYAKALYSLKG